MTNFQIIINEAIDNGIYTQEQIETILAKGYTIPLHTFATWKALGYVVKKGEHAKITTKLWRYKKAKKNDADEANADGEENEHYYLAKAFLFDISQVEKLSKEKTE